MVEIALYADQGANPRKLARALRNWGFAVTLIKRPDLPQLTANSFDLLYLPGGWYRFSETLNEQIRDFVLTGGGCIGTCAGAYNVAGYIPVIPGRVLRANFRGRLYLEPQQGSHPILRGVVQRCTRHKDRRWEPIAATHLGGPLILPEDRDSIVASYDLEGELGALVAASVGNGRAVAIASHPELPLAPLPRMDSSRRTQKPLPQGDESLIVRNAVLWATKHRVPKPELAYPAKRNE